MKRFLITVLIITCFRLSIAQTASDALRYSQLTFGGTARYNAMGGAFGALGADFSTLSSNPAGIALYRKNEITITPSVSGQTTQSTYNGSTSSGVASNFNFQNIGIIGTWNTSYESGWKSFNFGFGYNRTGDFNNNTNIQANNFTSSLTNIYLHNANGIASNNLDPFNEGLAYNAYLIDNPKGGTQYITYLPTGGVAQSKSTQTNGSMGETVISFGGNYADKFYMGATVGIPTINYSQTSSYSEKVFKDSAGGINSFQLNQSLQTTGTGINLKLGVIYKIANWVRIGAAYHSPTSLSMHDNYSSNIITNFSTNSYPAYSPNGSYDYFLTTPPRAIGSLGFIIAKQGLLGIDYEYVNYSYSSFNSSSSGSFMDINNQIKQDYKPAGNLRIGGEWKIANFISLRGGYAYYGNPYSSGTNINASQTSWSGGIGFRGRFFYFDVAYVFTFYKENYYLYDNSYITLNPVNNSYNATRVMTTFGFRF